MSQHQYANNPSTTLSGAATAGATSISVASATGFPSQGKFTIIVDSEIMLVTGVSGTTWTVTRGHESTTAAAHNNNAAVTAILTVDSFLNSHWLDVRQFGAKGDGTTDDTTAIQAALDALPDDSGDTPRSGGGGIVFFPEGKYKITSALTLDKNNARIMGSGPYSSTIYNTGTAEALIVSRHADSEQIQRFAMSDIGVRGTSSGTIGIKLEGAIRQTHLERVASYENGTWGLYLAKESSTRPTNRVTLIDCEFQKNYLVETTFGDGGAIYVDTASAQLWLYGCSLRTTSGTESTNTVGIYLHDYNQNVTIYGGDITTMGTGVYIAGDQGAFDAGTTHSIVLRGIYFENNNRHVEVLASNGAGASANVIVADNFLKGGRDTAVYVDQGRRVIVRDNYVAWADKTTGDFVTLTANAEDVLIGSNAFSSDFGGTVVDAASGAGYSYVDRYSQTKRATSAALAASATVDVTLTWDAPFPSTTYTVVVEVRATNASTTTLTHGITSKTASAITVRVKNNDATARDIAVEAIAIKDGI